MPRRDATRAEIAAFLRELGRRFKGSGSLFLVGGSMLVYQGYRPRTVDIDYRIELTSGDDGEFIQALRAMPSRYVHNIKTAFAHRGIGSRACPRR